jgi:hypothetical protein
MVNNISHGKGKFSGGYNARKKEKMPYLGG